MEKFNPLLQKLLYPHIAVVISLVPISAALLIYSFAHKSPIPAVAYFSYVLSAYALTIVCVRLIPYIYRKSKEVKQENKYVKRYLGDAELRIKISLYLSVVINLLYAAMQLSLGIFNHSVWYYSFAVYYTLLVIMRLFLINETRKSTLGENLLAEYERYRLCGVLLAVMNIALGVIVTYIVLQNRGFEHHYIHTIAMAAYTFFTLIKAIIGIVSYRKYESPVMSAAKAVSLAAALVSMLSLETAMFNAFGTESSPLLKQIMTACTGLGVCVIVLAMSAYMIVRSTWTIIRIKKEKSHE